jgi:3-hydroxymyristoyl/3-hydroxydecanoyl-(acyl carrier protein) dehydratase
MELTAFKERFGIVKMKGKAYVDGKIALEGEFTFALVKAK